MSAFAPEADAIDNNVIAISSIIPSDTVSLHRLVIMNISEHWTRIRAQEGSPSQGNNHNQYTTISSDTQLMVFSFPFEQLSVHWLANRLVATLRLRIRSNSNFNMLKKASSFVKIITIRKKNNVSRNLMPNSDVNIDRRTLNLPNFDFRQTSFQRCRFPRMVHDQRPARRTTHQNSQTNMRNEHWIPDILAIESTIAQFGRKRCENIDFTIWILINLSFKYFAAIGGENL